MTSQSLFTLSVVVLLGVVFPAFWLVVIWLGRLARRLERTLDRMEAATVTVAHNLAESSARADAIHGEPGEAADAAVRTADS